MRELLTVDSDYFHFDRLFSKLDRGRRVELCEALFVEARARKWDQETPQRYLQLNLDDEIRALELEQLASGYIRPASDSSGRTVRYPADSLALVRSSPRRGAAGSRYPISVASSREGRGFQGGVHSDGGDGPGAKSGVTRDDILPWKKHEPQGPRSQPQGARVPPARPPRPTLESLRREGAAGLMGSGEPLRGRRQGMARKSAGGTHKPTQVPPRDRTRRPALEIGSGTKRNLDAIGSPAK